MKKYIFEIYNNSSYSIQSFVYFSALKAVGKIKETFVFEGWTDFNPDFYIFYRICCLLLEFLNSQYKSCENWISRVYKLTFTRSKKFMPIALIHSTYLLCCLACIAHKNYGSEIVVSCECESAVLCCHHHTHIHISSRWIDFNAILITHR